MTVTCVDAGHRVECAGGSLVCLSPGSHLYLDVPLLGSVKADPTDGQLPTPPPIEDANDSVLT